MADAKITALPASAGLALVDLVAVVDDPSGVPVTQKATVQQSYNAINVLAGAAALAGADKIPTFQGAAAVAATLTQVLTFIQANVLSLNGSAFTIVGGSAVSATNGTDLVAAYAAAKTATPHGAALSKNNRFTIFLLPGVFTLTGGALVMDTQFIDLIGLSTDSGSMHWTTGGFAALEAGDIQLQSTGQVLGLNTGANDVDVTIANLSLLSSGASGNHGFNPTTTGLQFKMLNVFVQNTAAQTNAGMAPNVSFSGYYEDVRCWNTNSFGFRTAGSVLALGTFVRCKAAQNAFAGSLVDGSGSADGIFIDCEADGGSFGRLAASGTFLRCRFVNVVGAGVGMFGFGGTGASANGTFNECLGNSNQCFGSGSSSGSFYNCRSVGIFSAGGAGTTYSGTWVNCVGGVDSFGGGASVFSGTARNCIGGNGSFGGNSTGVGGTFSGTAVNCVGGNNSFSGGTTTGGTMSGSCRGCVGGTNCYGSGPTTAGTLSGTIANCSMTGTLNAVVTGSIIECDIDGWRDVFAPPIADSTTISNTAAETNFSTNISIQLRAWKAAKIYRFALNGKYSTDAVTPGTLILRVKLGTVVMALSKTITLPASAANLGFQIIGSITCRTIGATGTVSAEASFFLEDNLLGIVAVTPSNGTKTVDTTAAQTFQASAQFSVADADNNITLENIQLSPLAA